MPRSASDRSLKAPKARRRQWGYQISLLAQIEWRFFKLHPQLMVAALVVLLIPVLYLLIYLYSVWDPSGRATALPVGLVNLDQGFTYRDKNLNMGNELMARLRAQQQFGFKTLDDEQEARHKVRAGQLAFALIVPTDFSANALPGLRDGQGRLVIYTSAGNNYQNSVLAAQFARVLGEDVNRTLNEQRWALVLTASAGSQQSVDRLRQGLSQLSQGAKELTHGASQAETASASLQQGAARLQSHVQRLADGTRQLGSGIRATEAGLPPADDVRSLRIGAEALAAGHLELNKGMRELRTASQTLLSSVSAFKANLGTQLYVPAPLSEGLDTLNQGVELLDKGLLQAQEGQDKLSQGATSLSNNVRTLALGVRDLRRGMRSMTGTLPEDQQIDQLRTGAAELTQAAQQLHEGLHRLSQGASYLSAGLVLMAKEVPQSVGTMDGSAQGLAHSVNPVLEVDAPVANHGSGLAPNIIAAALWLGAGVAAFLIHVRGLPGVARNFSRLSQVVGKLLVPCGMVLLQAGLVFGIARNLLGITLRHPTALALTLVSASLAFFFVVFAMTRALGDAGKALAMLFLAIQISASGGFLPIELSGSLYAQISPWLPMTWVVRALKACMFGAYEDNWQTPLLIITLWGLAALVLTCFVGRWRYAPSRRMQPAMDF
jgi:putative membrane protein